MEKLRNILSPGHSKDDEVLYNTPEKDETAGSTGKVTGQGSHFGSSPARQEEYASAPGVTSAASTSDTPAQYTTREDAQDSTMRDSVPTSAQAPTTTTGGATSSAPFSGTSTHPTSYQDSEKSHVGQETAGGAGSAGALTAASLAFRKGEDRKASGGAMPGGYPSQDTSNPYAATHLDPRVDKEPRTTSSQTMHERSAGPAAMTAATTGTGAYEAERHTPQYSATEPNTSTASEPMHGGDNSAIDRTGDSYDESQTKPSMASKVLGVFGLGKEKSAEEDTGAIDTTGSGTSTGRPAHHRKESIPTTAYPSGTYESPRAINAPVGGTERSAATPTSSNHGVGAGTAAGAAGLAGAADHKYEEKRFAEPATTTQSDVPYRAESTLQPYSTAPTNTEEDSHTGRNAGLGGLGAASASTAGQSSVPTTTGRSDHTATTGQSDSPYRASSTPFYASATAPTTEESHFGRDAAIGTAAGAGAAGLAEEDHRRHEAERKEKEYMRQQEVAQKEREKQQEAAMRQREKDEAAAAKQAEKEQKAHEKAIAKEEKAQEKEEKKAAKEAEKEQKAAEKQAAKDEKHHEKLVAAEEKEREKEEKEARKHEAEFGTAGIGAAAAGTGAYEAERHHHGGAETSPFTQTGATISNPTTGRTAEPSMSHPFTDTVAGTGATGMAAHEFGQRDGTTTASQPHQLTGLAAADDLDRQVYGGKSVEPTGTSTEAPMSTTEPFSTSHGEPKSTDHHEGMSAAAAYAAEKEAESGGHTVPKDHHLETDSGLGGLAAADALDRKVYGGAEKKPSLFRRIFKSRKNKDTGDDEQYESDEEYEADEPGTHGHTHGHTTTGA